MAILTGAFNPDAEAQQDFAPLPGGEYVAQIVESDMKPTSGNTGHYLELVYEVTEGEFAKRRLWLRLNLDNPNAKTVEIANRQFAAIREATGITNPRDSQELHYKPHAIRVECFPAGSLIQYGSKKGQQRDRGENEIKGWRKVEGGLGNAPTQPTAAATPASPSSGASPWGKQRAA